MHFELFTLAGGPHLPRQEQRIYLDLKLEGAPFLAFLARKPALSEVEWVGLFN
jgi:hypothetical protein